MPLKVDLSPLSVLQRARIALPPDRVSLAWLERALDEQATFLLILVFALLGALPAASLPAGLAISILSLRLMFGRRMVALPRAVASRSVGTGTAHYAIGRAIHLLRASKRYLPVSRAGALDGARPVAGFLLFFLGLALLVPIPFSNVLPALSAAALILALIEGSVALFVVGMASAMGSILLIGQAVATAIDLISRV